MATNSPISIVNTLTIPQRQKFLEYARHCAIIHQTSLSDFRTLLAYRDRAYQRQLNTTAEHIKAIRANMRGDARKIQDMTVPIVMPQIESATAHQAAVFLTSYPIFGVIATDPSKMSAAMQFETALGDQSIHYGWARALIQSFRNGFKYNFAPVCVTWKKQPLKQIVTSTQVSAAGLAAIKEYTYGGNCIENIDPYNCFMDMTVTPAKMHTDGEFFGWNQIMSRVKLKQLIATLDTNKTTQALEAYESQFPGGTNDAGYGLQYYTPEINQYLNIGAISRMPGSTNWGQWLGLVGANGTRINYKHHYLVTHFYCRATQQDFSGRGNQVKVFHGIIVNWQVVLFVEELNTAHDMLPVMIMQPYEDGLGYQTQSMLDNVLPFQDMSSSLWNISLESKRRMIFDRLVYNPRYIDKKDIDSVSSTSRIPLRNALIGKEDNALQRAIYQIPYRDDNSSAPLQMSEMVSQMADQASGQNKVDRGQFQKGNKTKAEFDTTMDNSNSRQQLASLTIEQQFMTPVKEIVKSNTLQYQPAGKILNRESKQVVDVDPVQLRQAILEFKMTDGMLPADKMLNAEVLTVLLQTGQAIPGFAMDYDLMGMFLYWAKLKGAYWLDDFKRNPQQQAEFAQKVQAVAAAQSTGESAGPVQEVQAAAQAAPAGV